MTHVQPYILTGGPGTGKSTVLDLLQSSGFLCLPESAREIMRVRINAGLEPRPDADSFAQAILQRDMEQYRSIPHTARPVFIDRGIPDALCMLFMTGRIDLAEAKRTLECFPFNQHVFFFHPWEVIYVNDTERDQSFAESQLVSERLAFWYESLGFILIDMPKASPTARVEFIMNHVSPAQNAALPDGGSGRR
jgi:predicted ATPase